MFTYTIPVPSSRKRSLEVIRGWLERVVRGKFIDSARGIDEFWNWRRGSEISDPLGLHDVPDCPPSLRFGEVAVLVLNEGDNTHLRLTLGALKGVYFIYALDAGSPTTL